MKIKSIVILILCLLIGGIITIIALNCKNENIQNNSIQEFNLSDYQRIIAEFHTDKIVQEVQNEKEAIETAEKIWIEIYGKDIISKKPFTVLFDKTNSVWLISGSLPPDTFGGVPHILISTNGEVLAIWHDK